MDINQRLRAACNGLGLTPVGRVRITGYPTDLDLADADDWDNDSCWSLAYEVVSGDMYPEAGPLGFAAGHDSPGWRYLRSLVDDIAARIDDGLFDAYDYDEYKDAMETAAAGRARLLSWPDALVAVADLEVNEEFEDAKAWIGENADLAETAWTLLGYAGYQVCQDVFADLLAERNR